MTIRLLLVTHLMTAATRRAAFPSDEPIEASAGVQLRARPGTRVLRGPELRCGQTCERMGLQGEVEAALRDWDLGRWRGRTLHEVSAEEPEAVSTWLSDSSAAPHGGEALSALLRRVSAWLDGLAGAGATGGPDGAVVAVAHPAIARAALLHALAADPSAFWRLDVAPATVASFSGRDGRWNVSRLGTPLLMK